MKRTIRAISTLALALCFIVPAPTVAVSSNPTATCNAGNCIVTFAFTGDYYAWTAPASTTYTFELWGAQGGNAGYNGTVLSQGGKGGYASGAKSLTAGAQLYIFVGGQGAGPNTGTNFETATGGFNGGGLGFNGNSTTDYRAGGGGGGTDIRLNGNTLTDRIIVAGGGGGGALCSCYGTNSPGVGGGTTGGDGFTASYNSTYAYNGKGGTQSAGGTRGINGGDFSTNGVVGVGGNGLNNRHTYGGSGGGGGYYGGGGAGAGMGSGGGSGYVGGVTTSTLTAGNATMPNPSGGTMTGNTGNGFARITYAYTPGTISLTVAGNVTNANKGIGITLTAAINVSGNVTFYANKKRIAGCINMPASSGNKTCTWKPTGIRSNDVHATLSQSGSVVATSATLTIAGTKRTGAR